MLQLAAQVGCTFQGASSTGSNHATREWETTGASAASAMLKPMGMVDMIPVTMGCTTETFGLEARGQQGPIDYSRSNYLSHKYVVSHFCAGTVTRVQPRPRNAHKMPSSS